VRPSIADVPSIGFRSSSCEDRHSELFSQLEMMGDQRRGDARLSGTAPEAGQATRVDCRVNMSKAFTVVGDVLQVTEPSPVGDGTFSFCQSLSKGTIEDSDSTDRWLEVLEGFTHFLGTWKPTQQRWAYHIA
jgi:hypothetical protein